MSITFFIILCYCMVVIDLMIFSSCSFLFVKEFVIHSCWNALDTKGDKEGW